MGILNQTSFGCYRIPDIDILSRVQYERDSTMDNLKSIDLGGNLLLIGSCISVLLALPGVVLSIPGLFGGSSFP